MAADWCYAMGRLNYGGAAFKYMDKISVLSLSFLGVEKGDWPGFLYPNPEYLPSKRIPAGQPSTTSPSAFRGIPPGGYAEVLTCNKTGHNFSSKFLLLQIVACRAWTGKALPEYVKQVENSKYL